MKLILRLFWLFITQGRRARSGVFGPVTTTLRVFPNDLDIFFHVNNGVYLTYADLGRTDLMLRSGAYSKIRKQGWYPVVAGASIEFRRSLKLGQKFTITTRIAGWDTKAIYLEQVFQSKGAHVGHLYIDARFLSVKGDRVSSSDLQELLGMQAESPELPPALAQWIASRQSVSPPVTINNQVDDPENP